MSVDAAAIAEVLGGSARTCARGPAPDGPLTRHARSGASIMTGRPQWGTPVEAAPQGMGTRSASSVNQLPT